MNRGAALIETSDKKLNDRAQAVMDELVKKLRAAAATRARADAKGAGRLMAKKSEVQKLAGWLKGNKELVDPPARDERGDNLSQAEVADVRDEPEEQYNIRIRRSLKKRLKRLVIEEEKPMGVILDKMLELYLQHRMRRAERSDETHK